MESTIEKNTSWREKVKSLNWFQEKGKQNLKKEISKKIQYLDLLGSQERKSEDLRVALDPRLARDRLKV